MLPMTIYRRPDPIPRHTGVMDSPEPLRPLRDQSEDLNQLAARRIFMAIASNHWSHSEFLPKEDQLGHELGVSRTVVREAIKSLSSKSVVETRRRRGTAIMEFNYWNLVDREIIDWMSQSNLFPDIAEDLIQTLALTQPALAEQAALKRVRATELTSLAAKMKGSSLAERTNLILDFHLAVAQLTNNPFLQSLTLSAIEGLRVHHMAAFEALVLTRNVELYAGVALAIQSADGNIARTKLAQLFARELVPA
jgi:DNA-binding FadR family transcriptional regulator